MADIAIANARKPTTMAVAYDKSLPSLVDSLNGVKNEAAANGAGSKVLPLDLPLADPPSQNAASVVAFRSAIRL